MGLVYMTGFEEMTGEDPFWLQPFTTGTSTAFTINATEGRFGSQCLKNAVSGGGEYWTVPGAYGNTGATESDAIIGFAYKFSLGGHSTMIAQWVTTVGDPRDFPAGLYETYRLSKGADDILFLTQNGTVVGRGTHPLLPNRYYYIEWKAHTKWSISGITGGNQADPVAPPNGSNVVRLDGVDEIVLANGQAAGNFTVDGIESYFIDVAGVKQPFFPALTTLRLWYDDFHLTQWFDDLYVLNSWFDDTIYTSMTAPNTDFLGDVAIRLRTVDTGGTVTHDDWSNVGGSSKADSVSDVAPDGDNSYVIDDNIAGDAQTFKFGNVRSSPLTLPGIMMIGILRKTDIANRRIALVVQSGSTFYDSKDVYPLVNGFVPTDRYAPYFITLDNDPDTNAAWTETAINAIEAGVKLVT